MPFGNDIVRKRVVSLSRSIMGSKIAVFLLCLPFFKSTLYDSLGLGSLANSMLVVETCVLGVLFFLCSYRSRFAGALGFYFLWSLVIAPHFSGYLPPSSFYFFSGFGFTLLVLLGAKSAGAKFLNALSGVFCLAVAINAMSLLLFPHGLLQSANGRIWIFGIRTGTPYVLVPAICFCLIHDVAAKRNCFSFRTILTIAASIISIVNQWIATGLIELMLMAVFYIIAVSNRKLNYKALLFLFLLIGYFVLIIGPATFVGELINSLGKDMTLTGRTDIWSVVLADIYAHPIFGCGGVESVIVFGEIKAFHSLWLSVCHESGVVGLVLYIICFFIAAQNLSEACNSLALVVGCALFPIMLASIVEIQTYFPFIYGVLALSEYANEAKESNIAINLPVLMKVR